MLTSMREVLLGGVLHKGFKQYFTQGGCYIQYPDGIRHHYGPQTGGPTVRFDSWNDLRHIAFSPSLGFGDAYTAGRIHSGNEGDSANTAHDHLMDFLRVAAANRRTSPALRRLQRLRWQPSNRRGRQKANIAKHYDGKDDMRTWYETVLGPTMLYTCARYKYGPSDKLDDAQTEKVDDIGRKLGLTEPVTSNQRAENANLRLVDIGCGWGYMACRLAQKFGVSVLGITIAKDQLPVAQAMARKMGVPHLVQFELVSYQELGERAGQAGFTPFDGAYSVGMFEHVRHADYEEYFQVVRRLLKPHAPFVLHCIANQFGGAPDPWVVRRIFPGSRLGSLDQIATATAAAGFVAVDVENIYQHYVPTLEAWLAKHREHATDIIAHSGPNWWRERYLWLAASLVAFEQGDLNLYQIAMRKGKPPHGTLPWSRGHLYTP